MAMAMMVLVMGVALGGARRRGGAAGEEVLPGILFSPVAPASLQSYFTEFGRFSLEALEISSHPAGYFPPT